MSDFLAKTWLLATRFIWKPNYQNLPQRWSWTGPVHFIF